MEASDCVKKQFFFKYAVMNLLNGITAGKQTHIYDRYIFSILIMLLSNFSILSQDNKVRHPGVQVGT